MSSEYLRGPSSCPTPPSSVLCHESWSCLRQRLCHACSPTRGGWPWPSLCPPVFSAPPHACSQFIASAVGTLQTGDVGNFCHPLKSDMPGTDTRSVSILSINPPDGSAQPLPHLEDGHTEDWSLTGLTCSPCYTMVPTRVLPPITLCSFRRLFRVFPS